MSGILTIVYLSLFFIGLFNKKAMALLMPLFLFVYPTHLKNLSFGGATLAMAFILCGATQLYSKYQSLKNSKCLIRILLFYYIFIPIGSQIFSIFFLDYTELINCFKSILDAVICLCGLLYIVINICDEKYKRITILGLIISFYLEGVIAPGLLLDYNLFQDFYNWKEFDDTWIYNRASGTFSGPWALGGFSAVAIILLISLFGANKNLNINKFLIACAIVITLYTLVITLSRASWLFLLVSLTILIIRGNRNAIKVVIISIVLVFIASVFFLDWDLVYELVNSRILYSFENSQTGGLDPSTLGRFTIWDAIFKNYDPIYCITGYGIRHANNVFGHTPHNGYLSLFVYSGFVGYIIVYKVIHRLIRIIKVINPKYKIFIYSILLGAATYGTSADILYDTRVMAIIFIALISIITFNQQTEIPFKKNRI